MQIDAFAAGEPVPDLPTAELNARGEPANVYGLTHRSLPVRIAEWAAIRAAEPHLKDSEVAERMGLAPVTLKKYIYKARAQGLLRFDDPLEKLEFEIVPKAVDNLNTLMDAKDKIATLEVAKGIIFKQYLESKGISDAPQTVLALKIEMPEGGEEKIVAGTIVGRPRRLES